LAIVPLRQKVKVHKPDGEDEWGYPIEGETIEKDARVDEKTNTVTNPAGEEKVTGMEIMLDGLADVEYEDEIEFTDELDRTTKRKPEKIEPVRDIVGRAILTVVYL